MTLSKDAVKWAVNFVADHSDGDLFPRVVEIAAVVGLSDQFADEIVGKPLTGFAPGAHRRFIVPKDEVSYRQAVAQFDGLSVFHDCTLDYDAGAHVLPKCNQQLASQSHYHRLFETAAVARDALLKPEAERRIWLVT